MEGIQVLAKQEHEQKEEKEMEKRVRARDIYIDFQETIRYVSPIKNLNASHVFFAPLVRISSTHAFKESSLCFLLVGETN